MPYVFNWNLFKSIPLHCGFKVAEDFLKDKDCPFSRQVWYSALKNKDLQLSFLIQVCNIYHISPYAFFIKSNKVTQVKTDSTFYFAWETQLCITLSNGAALPFMKALNPDIQFSRRQRMLRPVANCTMKVSEFIYILNTHGQKPEDLILPDEQEKKTYR